jgi:hypothetical protein
MLIISSAFILTAIMLILHEIFRFRIYNFILIPSKQIYFIYDWNWLAVLIVFCPIYFYVILKLINFNLTSNKSVYKKLLISIATYSILAFVTIIAFFASIYL